AKLSISRGSIPASSAAARIAIRASLNSGSGDRPCLWYVVSPIPTIATLPRRLRSTIGVLPLAGRSLTDEADRGHPERRDGLARSRAQHVFNRHDLEHAAMRSFVAVASGASLRSMPTVATHCIFVENRVNARSNGPDTPASPPHHDGLSAVIRC